MSYELVYWFYMSVGPVERLVRVDHHYQICYGGRANSTVGHATWPGPRENLGAAMTDQVIA